MEDDAGLDSALRLLGEILESEVPIVATTRVSDTAMDSMDMLEWIYELDIDTDSLLDDDSFLSRLEELTIGELYTILIGASRSDL
jgi:hypothetical protein